MDHTSTVPLTLVPEQTSGAQPAPRFLVTSDSNTPSHLTDEIPFMNKMDEISYWITTKQAPCLFNYDNVIKRQRAAAHCSKPKSVQSILLETPPKKRKIKKLSLLDDDSMTSEKQQNVYFETSQNRTQQIMLNCESDTTGSDLDFNIKNSSIQNKTKKAKIKKSNKTTLHKKNKLVTSTPKVTGNLRRSLRKVQRSSKNSHINNSFEVLNYEVVNGTNSKYNNFISQKDKSLSKVKKPTQLFVEGDQSAHKPNCTVKSELQPIKIQNGQFDDMSDVSGFTANYIRSTKINSSKKLRNVRAKGSRNFIKESQQPIKKGVNTMLMCVNKSVNTGLPKTPLLNCSTDSSQNVINLITLKNNDKTTRVSRSTSLLKFMDGKNSIKKSLPFNQPEVNSTATNNVNISFQSKNSVTSRYPKRHKNSSADEIIVTKYEKKSPQSKIKLDKRRKICKNSSEFNHSDRKENPEEKISRTRSGKCIGQNLQQAENSVLVLSNSMEPVSSVASMNVATPSNMIQGLSKSRRRNCITKQSDSFKKKDRRELHRDSLRDKSGFTACFSDSDEDNEHSKGKKFFC